MLSHLYNPAGGLIYHQRAREHAKTIWAPFRETVDGWMREWAPPQRRLMLIGASAGYSLTTDWLRTFERVDAYDFDPLAPWLFRLRHRGVKVRWHHGDIFPRRGDRLDIGPLRRALVDHPDHAVLFSNVLGQLCLFTGDPRPQEMSEIRDLVRGRKWASYHDRLSGAVKPELVGLDGEHLSDKLLAAQAYGDQVKEIESHETERLGEGLTCRYAGWQILPNFWQLVEAVRS